MTLINFDSGSLVNNLNVTSATYGVWTFGSSIPINIINAAAIDWITILNQSGGRSILLNYDDSVSVTDFYFKSADGSDFTLNSFNIDNMFGDAASLTIAGYRDGALVVTPEAVDLSTSDSSGNITYVKTSDFNPTYVGTLSFNSAFNNIDEIRLVFSNRVQVGIDDIDITLSSPTITSATYNAGINTLVVNGTDMAVTVGAANDIDVSKLTLTGQNGASYTLTSPNVELDSATQFTVALNAADQISIEGLLNQDGTSSVGGATYNIAAAADWNPAFWNPILSGNADLTGNGVTVSNVQLPSITSVTYDTSTGTLTFTGSNLVKASGAANDIDASLLTLTGEGGAAYTLTDTADVEITSGTAFTVTLSSTDKTAFNQIVNKNGTSSADGTTYGLAAMDDWNTVIGNTNSADTTGNVITVSNVPIPTITSATYDFAAGTLAVTGSGFLKSNGFSNDVVASKFTFTGEGGDTYTLTNSANVEITSATAFTILLSATDRAAVNQIVNENGTSSTGGTPYNLAAAENWAAGADSAIVVADLTGNGITVSNVQLPTITSATYNIGTGALTVTGSDFLKSSGAANDIDASKFTFTGQGGSTYTLTNSADVEITSGTAFTLTLSSTDKAAVNLLLNKAGTVSTDATTYNLAATEDWAVGADVAVTVADLTGNGITVTIPLSPPGGSSTSTIIDGAIVTTTTLSDNTVVIVVPAIQSSRQDAPGSLSHDYADIPIAKDAAGNPLLTVSLPTGAGLTTTDWVQTLDPVRAEADFTTALTQMSRLSSDAANDLTAKAKEFLAQLPDGNPVSIHTVTPRFTGELPTLPIIISSSASAKPGSMLVIDARELPAGTVIQLDNVSFASIIGAARVTGGSGKNFVVGDNQNQSIVLGDNDDILSGGGGDDTIGSLGGNDVLDGGTGNDRLNGAFGFDSAVQAGQLSDYRIAVHGNTVTLTQMSGETDTLTDVELGPVNTI